MYSRQHHWAYLCGTTPIFVCDHISRVATPADIRMTACCARILIYEQKYSSDRLSGNLDGSASHGAATAAPKSDSATLVPQAVSIDRASASQVPTFPMTSDVVDQQASPPVAADHMKKGSEMRSVKHSSGTSGEQARREKRSAAVKARKRLQVSPNDRQKAQNLASGVRPNPQQRVLGDFFGALLPTMAAHTPVPNKGSRESFSVPNTALSLAPEQNHDLPRGAEAQPLIPADNNSAQLPSAVAGDSHTPAEATRTPPISVDAEKVSMSRRIVLKQAAPNSTPWIPGTMGLYPRPKGASAPNIATWQKSFPLWKVIVDGMKPQQAMFQTADNLSFNAFYTAADDWTQRDGRTWGIGKDMELSAMRQNLSPIS
jgi:hypothetical protein